MVTCSPKVKTALENKRLMRGRAPGQSPHFQVSPYFSGEVLADCSGESTGAEDVRGREEIVGMTVDDEKEEI